VRVIQTRAFRPRTRAADVRQSATPEAPGRARSDDGAARPGRPDDHAEGQSADAARTTGVSGTHAMPVPCPPQRGARCARQSVSARPSVQRPAPRRSVNAGPGLRVYAAYSAGQAGGQPGSGGSPRPGHEEHHGARHASPGTMPAVRWRSRARVRCVWPGPGLDTGRDSGAAMLTGRAARATRGEGQ
jgi:hypothetical protein